jgi:hypothetical protein
MQMYSLVMNTSLNSITCGWRSMRWLRISASTYLQATKRSSSCAH